MSFLARYSPTESKAQKQDPRLFKEVGDLWVVIITNKSNRFLLEEEFRSQNQDARDDRSPLALASPKGRG
ncbi:MAG: hypothetical protein V7L22_08065 [Nostoc sp.]|uniref:hypothetical protein n=1 Tax=Nostoc sp. TaxID=1180 RepID=UPI002FF4C804